jgi:phage terminase large subunit-like protein
MSAISLPNLAEVVELGAVDPMLFCRSWFPKTFRDPFPPFEQRVWDALDSSEVGMANIQMFRGSGKTTRLRAFVARRIGYGVSRVILYIGASEKKALQSVGWIKRVIETNKQFCESFGLSIGATWTNDTLQIKHAKLGHDIWVLGMGILGSHRGLNLDDYRPDLIIVDDAYDEESTATPEGREKIEDKILGALANSLAPQTESPDAKLVLLQTPFHPQDASMMAIKDPMWYSIRQGCWTKETERMPLDYHESSWEYRFPTKTLLRKKLGHISRNKKSLFARELECLLTTSETADFKAEWLKYFNIADVPYHKMWKTMAVDPVPKPTAAQLAKGLINKDYEVFAVVGYWQGDYYLLDYQMSRGHDPEWSVKTFFELRMKWKPKSLKVEPTGYQSTLAWLIGKAMQIRREYLVIDEEPDTRSKRSRIDDALSGPASRGNFYIQPHHSEFISQFTDYPAVAHDDVLDAVAMAMDNLATAEVAENDEADEDSVAPLLRLGGCP